MSFGEGSSKLVLEEPPSQLRARNHSKKKDDFTLTRNSSIIEHFVHESLFDSNFIDNEGKHLRSMMEDVADEYIDAVAQVEENEVNLDNEIGEITVKDMQQKSRSIDFLAYDALHTSPEEFRDYRLYLSPGNICWTILFGWWIALVYLIIAVCILTPISFIGKLGLHFVYAATCFCPRVRLPIISPIINYYISIFDAIFKGFAGTWRYASVLINLSAYIFWPFGKFVTKARSSHVIFQTPESDLENQASSIHSGFDSHYTPGVQSGDTESAISEDSDGMSESSLLLPHESKPDLTLPFPTWVPAWIQRTYAAGFSGFIFTIFAFSILGPIHLFVSAICFFFIVTIPMARLNYVLLKHLLRHPLRLFQNSPQAEAFRRAEERNRIYHQRKSYMDGQTIQEEDLPEERTPTPQSNVEIHHDSPMPVFNLPQSQHPHIQLRPFSVSISDTTADPPIISHQTNPQNIHKPPTDRSLINTNNVGPEYVIILSVRYAMGSQYYKYTFDGINIIFINFLSLVVFSLADFYIIGPSNGYTGIADHNVIFVCALFSVIPLAYFIGSAVSSITAQTGLAVGAVINATFGSVIEILLYILALKEGKERMVEGSIIGSFLLGLLALPGAAMFSGGLMKKEQRFNAKSTNVSSAMLIMALIGAFTPTFFQQIFGAFELRCFGCPNQIPDQFANIGLVCRSCRYTQPHPTLDPVYIKYTRPLMYFCAATLTLTYAVGLLFTLRTHSRRIYSTSNANALVKEKMLKKTIWDQIVRHQKHQQIQERILQQGPTKGNAMPSLFHGTSIKSMDIDSPRLAPFLSPAIRPQGDPKYLEKRQYRPQSIGVTGLGIHDETSNPQSSTSLLSPITKPDHHLKTSHSSVNKGWMSPQSGTPFDLDEMSSFMTVDSDYDEVTAKPKAAGEVKSDNKPDGTLKAVATHGGHDHPNWGTAKSTIILLFSTIAFSLIAEILIDGVDDLLKNHQDIDEKFLGLTLFAILPNNAIAFAMQGNIVLALEIGSAYSIQVALLQIPALVLFSAIVGASNPTITTPNVFLAIPHSPIGPRNMRFPFQHYVEIVQNFLNSISIPNFNKRDAMHLQTNSMNVSTPFTLVFPQWDVYAVLFSTFLLTYIYIEGKSNYFKGTLLLLAYSVLVMAFWFSPPFFPGT